MCVIGRSRVISPFKSHILIGSFTLVEGIVQMGVSAWGLMQYYCFIDMMVRWDVIVFIRIFYYHNPNYCGPRVNIGQVVPDLPNQAFVLFQNIPFTVNRTFIVNCVYVTLGTLWIITSFLLISGAARRNRSKIITVPWLIITLLVFVTDLISTIIYAGDAIHTKTLADTMSYIGATANGVTGARNIDTSYVVIVMIAFYTKFIILSLFNLLFIILVIIEGNREYKSEGIEMEAYLGQVISAAVQGQQAYQAPLSLDQSVPAESTPPVYCAAIPKIPRAGVSKSFRRMKNYIFNIREPDSTSSKVITSQQAPQFTPDASNNVNVTKKRTVNFPENLLSIPQRLENMIAEQQKKLDESVINTSGRSPPRESQSLPHLNSVGHVDTRGRRGTAAELQSQLPWAYVPAPVNRVLQQPSDEELPPVPLPDYTAIPGARKASVHRAASSLSSMVQQKSQRQTDTTSTTTTEVNVDVLY